MLIALLPNRITLMNRLRGLLKQPLLGPVSEIDNATLRVAFRPYNKIENTDQGLLGYAARIS